MKKLLLLSVILVGLLFNSGCANHYTYTKEFCNEKGEFTSEKTEYIPRFFNKYVNWYNKVEAFKLTTSIDPQTGSVSPQISLGWGWDLFSSIPLKSGEGWMFYNEEAHYSYNNNTGKTFIMIFNDSDKDITAKIKTEKKHDINLGFIRITKAPTGLTISVNDKEVKTIPLK